MKPLIMFCAMLLFRSSATFGQEAMKAPFFSLGLFKCDVEIPAGTPLFLETGDVFSSEQSTPGQPIFFRVKEALLIEGETVVMAGARATGRLKSIQPATSNEPETVVVEASYVQAVNGATLPIRGETTLQGQFPGEALTIPPGSLLPSFFVNNETLKL